MKSLIDLTPEEARNHFLKGSSYFNGDFPDYISFEPILKQVSKVLGGKPYSEYKSSNPSDLAGVNYSFLANKDGRFSWRPFELMHPAIYVSLAEIICSNENWKHIIDRLRSFGNGKITCCSLPKVSTDIQTDKAVEIINWWQTVEQESLKKALEFSHVIHTDVTDCYGSLYTHSISWAIHGFEIAKKEKNNNSLLGNVIDRHIRAGRFGQTNGIAQGSTLMDFVAEIVLGFVDDLINEKLGNANDVAILRYRDDYRIFAHSDQRAEDCLQIVSEKLRVVGMRLGLSKTNLSTNVIESSVKPDKLAGMELRDLGESQAKTLQKQMLRLHSFGRRFPSSGALRRLLSEFNEKLHSLKGEVDDIEVLVAIATDIAVISPQTIPVVAGMLSYLISKAPNENKKALWTKVREKLGKVPHNGYLEIWLQRVTKPRILELDFQSDEKICQIVNGSNNDLWDNSWIQSETLKQALDTSKLLVKIPDEAAEVVALEEVELFTENALIY
jgi:RNA-directed DNA polymerase